MISSMLKSVCEAPRRKAFRDMAPILCLSSAVYCLSVSLSLRSMAKDWRGLRNVNLWTLIHRQFFNPPTYSRPDLTDLHRTLMFRSLLTGARAYRFDLTRPHTCMFVCLLKEMIDVPCRVDCGLYGLYLLDWTKAVLNACWSLRWAGDVVDESTTVVPAINHDWRGWPAESHIVSFTTRYDTTDEFNMDWKAECGQLNLAHGARNKNKRETKTNAWQCPLNTVRVQDPWMQSRSNHGGQISTNYQIANQL